MSSPANHVRRCEDAENVVQLAFFGPPVPFTELDDDGRVACEPEVQAIQDDLAAFDMRVENLILQFPENERDAAAAGLYLNADLEPRTTHGLLNLVP